MKSLAKKSDYEQILEQIVDRINQKYPNAIILFTDEIYGDEDLNVDIFVDSSQISKIDEEVSQFIFDLTKETAFLILPTVAPMEFCPVK